MGIKILLNWTRALFLVMTLSFGLFGAGQVLGQDNLPTVTTDKLDYAPGEIAIVTGSGWTGDQLVDLHFEEDPFVDHIHDYHDIVVNADGTFRVEFPILDRHLGVTFTLEAKGQQTGRIAVHVFTDNLPWNLTVSPSSTAVAQEQVYVFTATTTASNANLGCITVGLPNGFSFVGAGSPTLISISTGNLSDWTISIVSGEIRLTTNSNGNRLSGNGTNIKFSASVKSTINKNQTSYNWVGKASNNTNCSGAVVANNGASEPVIAVNKANSSISVDAAGPFTYNTNPQGPDQVTKSGSTGAVTFSYVGVSGTTYAASSTKPTNAGSYEVTATLAGDDNYNGAVSAPLAFSIAKAGSTISVNAAGPFTFNATPQGPDQVTKSGSAGAVTFSYVGVSGTTYASSSTKPTNAGSYVVTATLAGDDNYNGAVSAPLAFSIAKATTTTVVTINGGPFTYTGSAITPATVSVTGAGGLNLTPAADYVDNINAGTATASYSYLGDANYLPSDDSKDFTIGKANATIEVEGTTVTYDGTAHGATGTAKDVNGETLAGLNLGASFTNVPGGTANWTFTDVTGNYNNANGSVGIVITPRPITISANPDQFKYCGQDDPDSFAYTPSEELIAGNSFSGNLSRVGGGNVGTYAYNLGSLSAGSNYSLTLVGSNTFEIKGVTIDASGSSTPVPMGQAANLTATISPAVAGVSVTFTVTNEAGATVYTTTVLTNGSGIATATTGTLETAGVLKVTATVGTGCATSTAYIPVYDASGSFVTGGGWINSPAGAMPANPGAVGKANFGFVSKYKKGSNQVDGNTEFQFQAGAVNFKSTMHESGSLVISGKKATYRGTGTINGESGYKFVVVAIDGNWNGQSNPDAFRIKITTTSGVTIYDNQIGKDENTEDATILGNNGTGGGSIVIHEVKKGNKRVSTELITVDWNTPVKVIKEKVDQMAATWFESRKLPMTLDAGNYDPLTPGIYELKVGLGENDFYELDEPIAINVLVLDKPQALDITISNDKVAKDARSGQVIGTLSTIDPIDAIHTYQIADNENLSLDGDKVIWTGTSVPAQLTLTVFSTDRAGQTISREIKLRKELKPGEFFMYPNPATTETNIMLDLDESATVAFQVYDAIGRLVIQDEVYKEGSFTHTIKVDGLAPGMYTVQLKVGNMVMTKRLIKK
ncbi:MAG: T9SS type A sorting domain-containing protein [Algoriphagus sp.]|uniref:T9SS type A sorting domain-containing protein n=1 Tax=Algoriphagus sp. TaxID=1872435 RepID=UPI0027331703|nr:T9SS type A sorting domain-containing protein [Algoriphagus sp.]MDP3471169.1 T9SS type A sorting domain-containing protein [Algoriphagus sp.]